MFIRNPKTKLPPHVKSYSCFREKSPNGKLTEEERTHIENFYLAHGVKHYNLPYEEHLIIFKRTLNFVYIVAHTFTNSKQVEPDNEGYKIIRSRCFLFYQGDLLYYLDHDDTHYPTAFSNHTTTRQRKLDKLNYGRHEELNDPTLQEIGRCCNNFLAFEKGCNKILRQDEQPQSIDFIQGE